MQVNYILNGFSYNINNLNRKDELTIMQACHIANVEIPRFCYYDGLSISGNCRMCLVEVKNVQKPVASCAIPLVNNMVIYTNSIYIYKIRESVLEYILINHPLDCPICDQAGECDLQDQAYVFGGDRSRYYEDKKTVLDKECGPFLTTVMTRCIHCTRCVRFYNEIIGVDVLGVLGRGNNMEISFYVKNLTTSELSGNLSDICPVGAILTKSHIFQKRSWELFFLSTFDVLDTFGSLIRIDVFGNKIFRILPRYNLYLNEEWITDKVRFFFDGYLANRLFYPVIQEFANNKKIKHKTNLVVPISWYFVFNFIQKLIYVYSKKRKFSFNVQLGNILELESLISIKEFFEHLGFNFIIRFENYLKNNNNDFSLPFFLGSYENLYKTKLLFLIGFNVRLEIPLLNLKFRKIFIKKNAKFIVFSNINSLNFYYKSIGFSFKSFFNLIEGRLLACKQLNNKIINFDQKIFLIGLKFYEILNYNITNFFNNKIKKYIYNIEFKIIHSQTSLLNSNEVNFSKLKPKLLNFDSKNIVTYKIMSDNDVNSNVFNSNITIKQNSHFIAKNYENEYKTVINLSSNSFLENTGIYFNLEGRLLKTRKLMINKKINVFKNFFIFYLIMKKLGFSFFKNLFLIRKRLVEINPNLINYFFLNFGIIKELLIFGNLKNIISENFSTKNVRKFFFEKKNNPYINDLTTKSSKFLKLAYFRIYKANLDKNFTLS